ncbi:hypothetical protein QCA50_008695 [Cerrena zonata]|uniref:ER transporter 6TM N-terminal domain-containing protein n=1 Tax=Cerrena zonata TaxID=2478898 RepID=A0AAW0GE45_9APHY
MTPVWATRGSNETEHKEARFAEDGQPHARKHVRLQDEQSDQEEEKPSLLSKVVDAIPVDLKWIASNWSYSKLKPVIRSAIMGWVSIILLIIPKVERAMGQAAFLVVVAAFLDPPSDPFIAVLEREAILLFLVCLAWAWSTLGTFLADLARTNIHRDATFNEIITGQYIEAGPTAVFAVFIFFGSSFFLWLKARQGPGPFTFGTVFGCIAIDISMTTALLFPYPYYVIGKAIVIPLVIHSALCLLSAAVVFPATMSAQYMACFGRVLEPLNAALSQHREVLAMDPSSDEFKSTVTSIKTLVDSSEASLASAGAVNRLLKLDIVWGRFAPADLAALQWWLRRLVTRSNGMGIYFSLIDPTRERFPVTPAPSTPITPAVGNTPEPSRPPSPNGDEHPGRAARRRFNKDNHLNKSASSSPLRHSISQTLTRHFSKHQHHTQHDHHLHFSLLHLAHNLSLSRVSTSPSEAVVGVFESQRYLHIESTRLSAARSPEATALFTELLHESCDELLENARNALSGVQEWVGGVRKSSFGGRKKIEQMRKAKLEGLESLQSALKGAVDRFRKEKRLRVLDPYRSAFDPKHIGSSDHFEEPPPHKFLFNCYMYEYHALEFANILADLLEDIIKLEKTYTKATLWLPTLSLSKILVWSRWDTDDGEHADDEDPDIIPGLGPEESADLGLTGRRDPDALPPSNFFEIVMSWLYNGFRSLMSGNSLFALKAGVLTILMCLPSFLKTTVEFAYAQRFIWAVFMGQLTLARWRGDTTFGLVSRIMATGWGCAVGLAMWYISAGSSESNPYGLAAVCAVCFPFFYYIRLYWPGPPMTNIIFFVTVALVIGYSWQNTHFPVGFHYFGWGLAWRRFIIVVAGVTSAFIFSFLPPTHTLRDYHRRMMARTVEETGTVYCAIVSFANSHQRAPHGEVDRDSIIKSLIAIRLKLKRSLILKTNIVYEFSLRGKWPSERYQKILEIQLQIAYLLSHLMSVVEHLEPAWARAFLRRTRFLDSDFQGDVLAVISLISTSLRTGTPLPQITPCPLLDRFMTYTHGLNIIRHEADDDYGLPRTMTIDTLENEQYLRFSVGVTTAFGIVMRLDRLMIATKELVGEQYHIHGVGLPPFKHSDQSSSIRPAKDA